MIGVILGGRIGYVLFYQFDFYLDNPANILKVWHGGMSFHGGFIGVLVATGLFAKKNNISFFQITDILACATPIGLFFGRIANFINAELYGRVTDVPWAVIFPDGTGLPRHPSQLYEAFLEGLVLFIVLFALAHSKKIARCTGFLSGIFLMEYATFRFLVEFVRKPDDQLGLYFEMLTMGQLLCIPMFAAGQIIFIIALKNANDRFKRKPE
jgi:phosphatidylglycerol:prolipoprotein diacylglycerol transferase